MSNTSDHTPTSSKQLIAQIRQSLRTSDKTAPVDPLTNQKIKDQKSDRKLKKLYAILFVCILIGQLLLMNLIFCCAGLGFLKFNNFQLDIFMGGTLAEVFGIVLVITKNLFPTK